MSKDDDQRSADERLVKFFPNLGDRKRAAIELARAIRSADALKHDCWSVTQPQESLIRLNVGAVRVLDLLPGKVRLAIDEPTGLSSEERAHVAGVLVFDAVEHLPSLGQGNGVIIVPPQQLDALPKAIRTAHEAFAARAARPSSFLRFHDRALLAALRELTGEVIPEAADAESAQDPAASSLGLARDLEDVRSSVASFSGAVASASDDVRWALSHPEYWVHVPETGAFAPAKFAAFVGMTPKTYRELQARQAAGASAPGFDGTRTKKHIEKLTGSTFAVDAVLSDQLNGAMSAAFGKETWGSGTKLKFLSLPAAVTSVTPSVQRDKTMPLNQLLYGPPGTGKTHATAALAVKICDGHLPSDRKALMNRYRELEQAGRIAFVTFHQSYGYEEFVEGIRPVVDDSPQIEDAAGPAGEVRYECRDGVFKALCASARQAGSSSAGVALELGDETVWKMSLGDSRDPEDARYEDALRDNRITLGYGGGIDFRGCDTEPDVRAKLLLTFPSAKSYAASAVHWFKNDMRTGDIVVVSEGNKRFRAVGRVRGDYQPPAPGATDPWRPVQWLQTFETSLPAERILSSAFMQKSIYQLREPNLRTAALQELLRPAPGPPKPHVLIIDEINRGNVSKILGELITLLEPDKRLGQDNELRVRLPHSGESFGVPDNVYVIGTMNTADRSIAFLDTALRRRFEFQELMPDPDVVERAVGTIAGIRVADVLRTLNDRIELLYDRDHTIGHAFFVDVASLRDLRDVFCRKVIPLLEEYFYGDHEKVCAVLGCPFDPTSGQPLGKRPDAKPIMSVKVLDPSRLLPHTESVDVRIRCTVNAAFRAATSDAELLPFFAGVLAAGSAATTET